MACLNVQHCCDIILEILKKVNQTNSRGSVVTAATFLKQFVVAYPEYSAGFDAASHCCRTMYNFAYRQEI